jgi:hypothetical protein
MAEYLHVWYAIRGGGAHGHTRPPSLEMGHGWKLLSAVGLPSAALGLSPGTWMRQNLGNLGTAQGQVVSVVRGAQAPLDRGQTAET